MRPMSELLSRRLLQNRFEGPHHEAILAVMLANAALDARFDEIFAGSGITQQQYNVLRILDGVRPGAHPRGEIARRMVRRAPDLTRMIDRLVRMGLVEREKGVEDHRQSLARITDKGHALVQELNPRVMRLNEMLASRMSDAEARMLAELAERIYATD